jgi:hypothetical protein
LRTASGNDNGKEIARRSQVGITVGGPDDGETIRVLPFCTLEIPGSIYAQQVGNRVIRQAVQQHHAPA